MSQQVQFAKTEDFCKLQVLTAARSISFAFCRPTLGGPTWTKLVLFHFDVFATGGRVVGAAGGLGVVGEGEVEWVVWVVGLGGRNLQFAKTDAAQTCNL